MAPPLRVLYEDNHVLAVWKPAGLATMGLAEGETTLLTLAKQYLKQKYDKPGNVYLGIVSRLDVPVTGVVVMGRTSKASDRLNEQFRARTVEKTYWALVEGRLRESSGRYVDTIVKDERHRHVRIVRPEAGHAQAQQAALSFHVLERFASHTLLEIRLETGRKHQIRVQMAWHGHPILGDRKYKSARAFPAGIALHARRIVIDHPVQHQPLDITAEVPPYWAPFGVTET